MAGVDTPVVVVLGDEADLWSRAEPLLDGHARVAGRDARGADPDLHDADPDATGTAPDTIGIVTWSRATRDELAGLPALRERHGGPLVALLRELPSVRGARVLAARLEGTVLAAELERSLIATLVAVHAGQCVVPRSVRQLVDRPPLSPRERQVLAMVVLDFSNAEIARKLVVTESNVKNHLTSAFAKLGVTSRNAAVELILDRESGLGPGILRISPDE